MTDKYLVHIFSPLKISCVQIFFIHKLSKRGVVIYEELSSSINNNRLVQSNKNKTKPLPDILLYENKNMYSYYLPQQHQKFTKVEVVFNIEEKDPREYYAELDINPNYRNQWWTFKDSSNEEQPIDFYVEFIDMDSSGKYKYLSEYIIPIYKYLNINLTKFIEMII